MMEEKVFELILFLLSTKSKISEEDFLKSFKERFPQLPNPHALFKQIYNLEYLNQVIEDIEIKEIIVHSHEHLQIERKKGLEEMKIFDLSPLAFKYSLEVLAHRNNISWNFKGPYPSFFTKINDLKFRATLVHPCTGIKNQAKLFLRKIRDNIFNLKDFNIPEDLESFLKERVKKSDNMIIAGRAGSGKTTFLATLMSEIPKDHHVVVLEDTHEIPKLTENFTFFLGQEGQHKKTLQDYYSLSLRLRPDRIILGEMRSYEIIPLILSLNTGHRGVLSTIHSDNAKDCLTKMALLFNLHSNNTGLSFENSLKVICHNIDYVIYLENQKVKELIKVIGSTRDQVIYENKM